MEMRKETAMALFFNQHEGAGFGGLPMNYRRVFLNVRRIAACFRES